ncbi:MAG TPA: thioredoxin domain-containing protein [Geobacteraceae bacterium]
MGKRYRIFVLTLLAAGLILSVLSATDLCSFGGCTEAHQYLLFGFALPWTGIVFFTMAGLLVALKKRIPSARLLFNLLLAGAAGSEVNLILLQKYVIRAWCPLCLGIAAIVYLLAVCQLVRYVTSIKEEFHMRPKSAVKPLLMSISFLLGFYLTFSGLAKPDAAASQLNLYQGKQDSKLEVYLFSDWLCPFCARTEGAIEAVYPALSRKARFLFVDKIVHPEAMNFVPYDISFALHEKTKYLQLRKALFALAQKTRNPSYEDIKGAIAPLKVTYRQLSFLDVTQQMTDFQKLAGQFKVTSTPTLVIRNGKTGKTRTLTGNSQITPDQIMKAAQELE